MVLYLVDQVGQVYPLHLLVQMSQDILFVRQDLWDQFVQHRLAVLLGLGDPGVRGDPVGHLSRNLGVLDHLGHQVDLGFL